jgi:two-component sensor histidine kinase
MSLNPQLDAMNSELADASVDLVSNGDFLRGVLAGCGDCIKILDLDGRLQFMSDGGKRVMEVEDFGALKGCPWPDFWTGEGNAQAHAAVQEAKAGRIARFKNAANTAKGTPRYWDVQVSPIFGADGKPSHLLSISRDITEEWKNAERQKFLSDELTHRVKNTLATVVAIMNQTFGGDAHNESRKNFAARIKTLSDAYDVLNETNWTDTSTARVVETALKPYQAGQFAVSGPEHELSPNQALALALALNELATNALKYGALSISSGKVDVRWRVAPYEDVRRFQFEWRESGGPSVMKPTRTGFGSRLIRSVLAEDFAGTVDLQYEPTGVVCLLEAGA